MTTRKDYESAREEHKAGGPYKSAMHAVESKTFSKMHNARKALHKSKALDHAKSGGLIGKLKSQIAESEKARSGNWRDLLGKK